MPGLDPRRLALVIATVPGAGGDTFRTGTGYFVSADLVLTASHVVDAEGLTALDVRTEADATTRVADPVPVWRDALLDAALIRIQGGGLGEVEPIAWLDETPVADLAWHSSAYPDAGKLRINGKPAYKTVGLDGTLHAGGGGGQGARELDLSVKDPPTADDWAGASGAPVFVGERLAGFIAQAPRSFEGRRLAGIPAASLLQNHGFLIALSEPWLAAGLLPQRPWVLVVLSEGRDTDLGDWVDGTLESDREAIESALGAAFEPVSIKVRITDALRSPGHWLRFVGVLCAAPLAIFDATGFEPAVMLALGVRAVVRRGVTITSTAQALTPAHLSALPFNIQETKLVHHGSGYDPADEKHPHKRIAAAIKKGWKELHSQPRYLDLPAYDGVRCPYPAASADDIGAVERILVLCAFGAAHDANWLQVSNAAVLHYPRRKPARMLDVASPRLVGQALYEGIRWARTCIVDWTGWRANVFFELGVRLACAEIGPVNLIDAAAAAPQAEALAQQAALLTLLRPAEYAAKQGNEPLRAAFRAHDATARKAPPPLPASALPHDATYRACLEAYDWAHEAITVEPVEALRRSVRELFGTDPQAAGQKPVLYSANPRFNAELERSVSERWIAAWHYLEQRHPRERWAEDAELRRALDVLANQVLQFGLHSVGADAQLLALRKHIEDVIDELDALGS